MTRTVRVVLVLGLLTLVALPVAYYALFGSTPVIYDDEGYFLMSIKLVAGGGRLYDDVATGYGPAYYLLFVPLAHLFGGIGHDTGRWIVLVLWLGGCLTAALGLLRLTGSLLVAGVAFALCFKIASPLTVEPMNPAALLNVLLLGMVVCAAYVNRNRWALAGVAVLVMLAGLVKINIGAYAGMALVFALLAGARGARPALFWGGGVALLCAFPALLLAQDFSATHGYIAVVVLSGAGVIAAAAAGVVEFTPRRPWLTVIAGLAGTTVAVAVLTIVGFGTTPHGLWDGTVGLASDARDVFTVFQPVALRPTLLSLVALPFVLRRVRSGDAGSWWIALLRLLPGAVLVFVVISRVVFESPSFEPVEWVLPVAWLAALPDPRGEQAASLRFARVFAAALAVTESLYAYPVAGTQQSFASVPEVTVGCICLADGVRLLAPHLRATRIEVRRDLVAVLGASLLALVVWASVATEYRAVRHRYDKEVVLGQRDAGRLHVDDGFRQRVEWIDQHLRGCSTFVPLLGMNSMYMWSGKPAPAFMQQNWPSSMSDARQARIVAALRNDPHACLLVNFIALTFWAQGRTLPSGPLVEFTRHQFRMAQESPWSDQVWVRKATT